jgi:hypothetical protein
MAFSVVALTYFMPPFQQRKQVHAQVPAPQQQSTGYVPPGRNTWP